MSNHIITNFQVVLPKLLRDVGLSDCYTMMCALERPKLATQWTIKLPEVINSLPWTKPDFRLVVHAQDFVHINNNVCGELAWLEANLTPEQQSRTIFMHWDHDLNQVYSGPIHCVEFSSHSYEIAFGLKENYLKWKDVRKKNYEYNWLCLNGRPRPHRNQVYERLKDTPRGLLTHSVHRPLTLYPYSNYYYDNISNFSHLVPAYQQSRVSVITESLYQDTCGIITEKTLFAMAAEHPFMCIGHRHIHRQIRERGFKTFDNLFDLSYDTESDSTRLQSAVDRNLDVITADIDPEQYKEQTKHNFEWLMTGYADSLRERAREQLAMCL